MSRMELVVTMGLLANLLLGMLLLMHPRRWTTLLVGVLLLVCAGVCAGMLRGKGMRRTFLAGIGLCEACRG